MRRSSLNEDLIRRRFSHATDRVNYALESLALIDEDDADDNYGSIEDSQLGGVVSQKQTRRISSLAEEGALLKDELYAMITLAVPVIATYLLEIIPGLITIILVGRIRGEDTKLYIDSASLAVMYFNIVGLSTGLGLLTAMDTLCASAHGAGRPSKMGKYLLTGIVLMSVVSCIVGTAIYKTTDALLFFGQPQSVAREAGTFAMWMLPGLPFLYAYELLRKLSQARNETTPMILSAVMSVIVNICLGYYLVNYTHWGWLGAALARTLGYIVLLPTLFLGMYRTDREFLSHVWDGFRLKEATTKRAISKFLHLGIPGMLQVMFEWAAFELIALLCGIFSGDEALVAIGANAIDFQVSTLLYMLYLGASVAGSVRTGNALGAGDVHRAKIASYLTVALGILLSLMNIAFIIGFRERLPYFFTTDEDLIKKAKDLFIIVAIYQLPDAVNGVEQGIFRAIGKQSLCATLNFIAYYIVGIPLGYALAFILGLGVEGLWLGMTVGLIFVSFANTIILFRSDWQALSLDTRKRLSISVAGP